MPFINLHLIDIGKVIFCLQKAKFAVSSWLSKIGHTNKVSSTGPLRNDNGQGDSSLEH